MLVLNRIQDRERVDAGALASLLRTSGAFADAAERSRHNRLRTGADVTDYANLLELV